MKNIVSTIIIALIIVACGENTTHKKNQLTVTIAPLAWIVENLTDSTSSINVIVPSGTSPETYEPTARQIEELNRAQIIFSIGLIDFEHQIEDRLRKIAPEAIYMRLADSLTLIEGSCAHADDHDSQHKHEKGQDPHVWLSPKMMRQMAQIVARQLVESEIESQSVIDLRLGHLLALIDTTSSTIQQNIERTTSKTFAIVHPSLAYFAADYGLRQMAIEDQGKEPSGARIKALIDTLRAENIQTIIYSQQDPATAARVIASEIGGRIAPFDPMSRDWAEEMVKISEIICKKN